MKVVSNDGLSFLQEFILTWKRRIRYRFGTTIIEVSDDVSTAKFRCHSAIEERRAVSLFYKEEGTINWLRNNLKSGQVFIDVGANVGIYSVIAAQLVGSSGKVFSFEPHAANFISLLENIVLNGLEKICMPLSIALSNEKRYLPFHYATLTSGSSMSQLDKTIDPDGNDVSSGITEIKASTSLDELIQKGIIDNPHHIKIDVDGIEEFILKGVSELLTGSTPPLSIQVEVQSDTRLPVIERMNEYDYVVDHIHHTELGKTKISQGISPLEITHNIVFIKR